MIRLCFAFALLALVGCGKATEPPKVDEPKPGEKKEPPSPSPPTPDPGPLPPAAPSLKAIGPNDPSLLAAERFISDLRVGSEVPGPLAADLMARVSPGFLKIIGRPLLSDEDKKLGHSSGAASAWLKLFATKLVGVSPPTVQGTPSTALLTSAFAGGHMRLLIRMTFLDGWKVDWLSMGVFPAPAAVLSTADGFVQDFAVLAFLDAITARESVGRDQSVRLLAGVMSTKLKNSWADPFESDKTQGLDYNAGKLGLKLDELARNVTGISRSQQGPDVFKVELPLSGERPAYTLKLVKGAAPGEWLVDEFTKQ